MVEVEVKRKDAQPPPGRGSPPHARVKAEGCGPLILKWVIYAAVVYFVAWLLEPHVRVDTFAKALLVAAVLGVLNTVVRPIMILLTLPITVVTLGLFLLVINALLILFAGWLVPGFHVESFGWALLAGVVISVVNALVSSFLKPR